MDLEQGPMEMPKESPQTTAQELPIHMFFSCHPLHATMD
jgi:hypothetical protein